MSLFHATSRGVLRTHLGFLCSREPRVLLSKQSLQHRQPARYFRSSSIRRTAASLSPQNDRLGHDEPFERSGGSQRAFQTTSKPDYLLSPSHRYHPIPNLEADDSPPSQSLVFSDGQLRIHDEAENRSINIPGQWLRDNCSCSECRNTDTAQRQINVLRGDMNFEVVSCEAKNGPNEAVEVTFGDGHRSSFPVNTLLNRNGSKMAKSRYGIAPITIWNAEIKSSPPSVPHSEIIAGAGMGPLLHKIRTWGFCIADNMPATPEATEELLKSIGPIRDTHYGAFYDFTADLTMKDTAYTSEFLEPHTDNTYFTEPAGLQALHMLSHTEGSGGESSLVDGFGAAVQLFVEDREAYLTLSEIGVYAHASGNEGISIQPGQAYPVFNHDREGAFLTQVRWNNADRAGLATDFASVERWYDAAAKFDKILNAPENLYWFQLKPGQTLLFDNWRVMHGRNSFTGKRRMCGGYINRDDFISKYRMTNLSAEDIKFSTVTG